MRMHTLRHARTRVPWFVILLAWIGSLTSCASTNDGFWARHTDGEMWSRGAHQFQADPSQWVGPLVLTAATPIAWIGDADTSEDSVAQKVFNTNTQYGDDLSILFLATPVVVGGYQAFGGDARLFETSLESIAFTMAATYGLKSFVNRERPDGSSEDSFPSGHTSAAFAGATLIELELSRRFDDPWWSNLVYVPATYVGLSRLEGERHYLADILFGAALGIAITDVTWNAHFGAEERRETSVRLAPVVGPGIVGVGLDVSF